MISRQDYQDKTKWKYERPSLAVDSVLLRYHEEELQVLLLRRTARFDGDDQAGELALVGGFQPNGLALEDNLIQKIFEKTGFQLKASQFEQLATFSEPEQDSQLWVVSVAFLAYLQVGQKQAVPTNLTDELVWVNLWLNQRGELQLEANGQVLLKEDLAFDHFHILQTALLRIKGRLSYQPTVLSILPAKNTMSAYRKFYACFWPGYKMMNSTDFWRKHKRFFTKTDQKVKTSKRQAALFTWQID